MGLGVDTYGIAESADGTVDGWFEANLCAGGMARLTEAVEFLDVAEVGYECNCEFGDGPHCGHWVGLWWCGHMTCEMVIRSLFISILTAYDEDEQALDLALDWSMYLNVLARSTQPVLDLLGIRSYTTELTETVGRRFDHLIGLDRPRGRPRKVA